MEEVPSASRVAPPLFFFWAVRVPRTLPPAFFDCGFTLFHSGAPAASPFASLAARAAARVPRPPPPRCSLPASLFVRFHFRFVGLCGRPGLLPGCCPCRFGLSLADHPSLTVVVLSRISFLSVLSIVVFGAASRRPPRLLPCWARSTRRTQGATLIVCRLTMAWGRPPG